MKKTHTFAVWAAICGVLLAGAVAAGIWGLRQFSHQTSQGAVAAAALCAFKADLQTRLDSSVAFLRTHPRGLDGIPAATIRITIVNEQATLRSLAILHCPDT